MGLSAFIVITNCHKEEMKKGHHIKANKLIFISWNACIPGFRKLSILLEQWVERQGHWIESSLLTQLRAKKENHTSDRVNTSYNFGISCFEPLSDPWPRKHRTELRWTAIVFSSHQATAQQSGWKCTWQAPHRTLAPQRDPERLLLMLMMACLATAAAASPRYNLTRYIYICI